MRKVNILDNQKGFTLIEIIAVLVILGILAAVAVPKFMSLTETAQKKAVEGALSSGLSTVSMQYAKLSLLRDKEPIIASLIAACTKEPGGGDFTFTFANGTTANTSMIRVKVGSNDPNNVFTAFKLWKKP